MCARDAIDVADLNLREMPTLVREPNEASRTNETNLIEVERSLIVEALRQHGGNVTLAARKLGVSRDTLRYRMEKYALRREDYV